MASAYLDPEDEPGDKNQSEKSNEPSAAKKAGTIEKRGPKKNKNFKVLHKDGSLPDHPYNNEPGGGALEGTVGIGT